MEKRMDFPGAMQTTYSDWAKTLISYYPFNPRFALDDTGTKTQVFYENKQVAEFDFSTGTGFLLFDDDKMYGLDAVGTLPNFEPFNIESMLQ